MSDLLFDLDDSVTSSYLNNKPAVQDGLFRPKLEQAKNKAKGYIMTGRFLPNFTKEGTIGPTAIEKHVHYAKFQNDPNLSGYYDCKKNFGEKCEMCDMFWALKKSKNSEEQEKAELINRTSKYYAYFLIYEDENQPELEGKIVVFPFGFKIKEKIRAKKEHPKNPCDVEDLSRGMDFTLCIKEVGGFANYDSSEFDERGPLKKKTASGWKPYPLNEETGKIDAKYHAEIKEFLLNREHDLEEFAAKKLTDEQQTKVNKILAILSGQYVPGDADGAPTGKNVSASDVFESPSTDQASSSDDFSFDDEPPKTTKAKKKEEAPVKNADADPFFDDF